MMEPKRLFEEPGSDLERTLLTEGRRRDASDRRRMATLVALGVGAAAVTGTKTGWAMLAGWKKAIVGTALVASTGVGSVVAYRTFAEPADADDSASTAVVSVIEQPVNRRVDAPSPEAKPPAGDATEVESAPEQPQVEPVKRTANQPARKSAPATAGKAKSSIHDEVALLDRARAAASGGNGQLALRQLDRYASEFPKGSLQLEAEVLRIQALAAAGRTAEASRRAKRLLNRSPNSVVAARLRRYVVE